MMNLLLKLKDFLTSYIKEIRRPFDLLDIISILLLSLSSIGLLSLRFSVFNPILVIILSLISSILFIYIFSNSIVINKPGRKDIPILLILAIALFFRINPSLYLSGGQDQGLYISMSKSFEIEGDWHPTDEFRNSLTSEQKEFYDRNRSGLQSGITVINNETSDRVMPFYPLFPTLLSITGSILGGENRVYILTLFSILTVYLFYKITLYLTNKRTVAYLSALFLAINPIHVFFSNFPLTEIIAIGFVFFVIYYIFRYVSEVKQNNNGLISLIFMSGLLMAFYLTRLSFFFYIPILLLLFLILLTFVDTKKRIKEILCFIVTNIVFFVVSTYLYSKFAYNELFFPTFSDLLKSLLGTNYMLFLSLIVFAYTLLITGILLHKINLKPIFKYIFNNLWSLIVLIFVILIIAVFLKNYYDLGYTNLYRGDLINNYGGVFKEANSLQYLFLYVLFNYLSPFLLLIYLIGSLFSSKYSFEIKLVILVSLIFFLINSVFLKFVTYNYYYARYILPESITFSIILSSIFLGKWLWNSNLIKRISSILAIFLVILYFLYFSIPLTKGQEGANKLFFEEITKIVDRNDLILINNSSFSPFSEVITPINYYYDRKIVNIKNLGEVDNVSLTSSFTNVNHVYLLTMEKIDRIKYKDMKTLNFEFSYFSNCRAHIYSFLKEIVKPLSDMEKLTCSYTIIPTVLIKTKNEIYMYQIK